MTAVITPGETFWREATEGMRQTVPLNFPDWMDTYFYLSGDSSAGGGQWRCYPYQRGLCLFMADLDITDLFIKKQAQIGATKIATGLALYSVTHRGRNAAVTWA